MNARAKPTLGSPRRPGRRAGANGCTTQQAPSFARATAVHAVGDGCFVAELHDGWSVASGPSGGYLAAIVVRALTAGGRPATPAVLRSLNLNYLVAPQLGPLEIQTTAVQAGRRVMRSVITALQGDATVLTGTATFSAPDLPVAADWHPPMPAVSAGAPASLRTLPANRYTPSCRRWLELPHDHPAVIHRARLAPQFGCGRFSGANGKGAPETGGWTILRRARRVDPAYLAMCADLWWPAALEPVSAGTHAPTLELSIHFRTALPADGLPRQPILAYFRSSAATEGLVDEDGALFLGDGQLLAQVRQLSLLTPA
jgi:acyl-CoA thioesterase